jgi:competence protein ComEA
LAPPNDPTAGTPQAGSGPAPALILVHVAGAVKAPGVYGLKEGQRLYEAVALAGPEEDADLDALNLASPLHDAQKVYVPRKGESVPQYPVAGAGPGASQTPAPAVTFPININSATQRELDELPGIGPVLAGAIVARRDQFGPFERPEDLKNVPGIGEKTYARIAALVTVR